MENRINNLVQMKPQYATQLLRAARLLGVKIRKIENKNGDRMTSRGYYWAAEDRYIDGPPDEDEYIEMHKREKHKSKLDKPLLKVYNENDKYYCEIEFNEKPGYGTLSTLKSYGFIWNGKVWRRRLKIDHYDWLRTHINCDEDANNAELIERFKILETEEQNRLAIQRAERQKAEAEAQASKANSFVEKAIINAKENLDNLSPAESGTALISDFLAKFGNKYWAKNGKHRIYFTENGLIKMFPNEKLNTLYVGDSYHLYFDLDSYKFVSDLNFDYKFNPDIKDRMKNVQQLIRELLTKAFGKYTKLRNLNSLNDEIGNMENRINNLVKMKPKYAAQLQRAARLLGVEMEEYIGEDDDFVGGPTPEEILRDAKEKQIRKIKSELETELWKLSIIRGESDGGSSKNTWQASLLRSIIRDILDTGASYVRTMSSEELQETFYEAISAGWIRLAHRNSQEFLPGEKLKSYIEQISTIENNSNSLNDGIGNMENKYLASMPRLNDRAEYDELAGLGKLDTNKQRIEKLARSGKFAPQLARAAKLLKIKPTAKKAKAIPPIDKPCTTCEVKHVEPEKPTYTPRAYSGRDIVLGKRCKIITPNGNLDGQYAVAEIDFLIPSNNPFTFAPNPNYPAECQTRSYNEDQAERDKVAKYTDDFNYSHLINNSPDATTGTPICNLDGAVLGGNGRTMVMYRIIEQNKRAYAEYVRELHDMAGFFGLPEDIVDSFDNPVLLRIVDVQLRECSTVSNMLNKSNSNEYDAIREGIAFARQIEENKQAMDIIVGQLENSEADTFSEMMNDKTIAKSIINLLRNMKIINTTNQGSLIESDNQFTAKGKDFMEAVLLAMILPDKKLINGASSYTLKLVKALPSLLRMKNFPAEWNLIPVIRKITEFEIKRRAIGTPFKDYINQQSAFEAMPSEIEAETWKLLEVLGQNQFKSFVAYYSDRYLAMKDDMFGEKISPIQVIKLYQQKYASELKSKGLADELAGLFWSLTDDSEQVEVIEKTENTPLNDEIGSNIAENTTLETKNDIQSDEPAEPKPTVTLSDMQKYDVKTIQFHDKILQTLLERIRIPFQILLWGKAGGGKSTFAVRMCNELSQHGKVLYHTSEEELQTGRFIDRMKLMGAETDKIKFSEGRFPELLTALNSEKFDFVVVDSMNRIGVPTEELNEMMKEFKSAQGTSFIIIAHADKTGKIYKGDSGVAHDVDTEINITEGIAQAIKHRDGETGKQVSIFPSKQFKYRNPTTIALPMNAR